MTLYKKIWLFIVGILLIGSIIVSIEVNSMIHEDVNIYGMICTIIIILCLLNLVILIIHEQIYPDNNHDIVIANDFDRINVMIYKHTTKTQEINIECSICLEIVEDNQITLNCNHTYHSDCLTKWLFINKICPLCRQELSINI